LLRQACREGLHAAVINQLQFLQANRAIKNHVAIAPVLASNCKTFTTIPVLLVGEYSNSFSVIPV
jgi:hypothetical protein